MVDNDSGENGEVVISIIPDRQGTYFSMLPVPGNDKVGQLVSDQVFSRDEEDLLNGYSRIDGEIKYRGTVFVVAKIFIC